MAPISVRVVSRNSASAPPKSISMSRRCPLPARRARRAADRSAPPVIAATAVRKRDRSAEVEVRVVLEGEADAAEHLDAVLGDGHGAVEGHGRGDVGGEVASSSAGRGAPTSHATAATDSVVSSISAQRCLTAWNEPMGAPNCSRTLA